MGKRKKELLKKTDEGWPYDGVVNCPSCGMLVEFLCPRLFLVSPAAFKLEHLVRLGVHTHLRNGKQLIYICRRPNRNCPYCKAILRPVLSEKRYALYEGILPLLLPEYGKKIG